MAGLQVNPLASCPVLKKRIEEEVKMTKEFEKADREAAKDKIKKELKNLKNVR